MKKSLIPAAILLSLAGAAHADLTIYGLLDVSYGKSIIDDINELNDDIHSGGDNGSSNGNSTSRFGLKGSTDVGSGIKANFKLESNGITSNGDVNTPFFGRQAWFGLSGGFGEFRVGRQDSVAFQTMVDYDFNGASNGVSSLGYSGIAPWLPGRQSRSVQYLSPNLGGFTAQIGYVPEGNEGPGAKAYYSLGAKYALGDFSVAVTTESKRTETSKDFSSVAASYDFGFIKLMGSYADGGKAIDGGTGKGFGVGFNVPVAGFNIGMLAGKNSDDNIKATAYEVWINKEVLKNTYVYLEGGSAKYKAVDPNIKGTGYALGMIYTF